LREAFDAVAAALCEAAEMRRCPPNSWASFEAQARALAATWRTARYRYAAAEIPLRAVTDDGGRCAHQEALNAVCRINDACGHVILASRRAGDTVSSDQAVAHILDVPAFDLAEMLVAMRRQTSLAALRVQKPEGDPPVGGGAAGTERREKDAPRSDGLTAPWEGDDWDALEPLVRRLLTYMHGREKADLRDLCPVVWGKDYADVSDPARETATSKANRFLSKRGSRRTLHKASGEPILCWQ
jgi:hypothetical protein